MLAGKSELEHYGKSRESTRVHSFLLPYVQNVLVILGAPIALLGPSRVGLSAGVYVQRENDFLN